jgi:ABC-type microcin C transport system permease subunit YejE
VTYLLKCQPGLVTHGLCSGLVGVTYLTKWILFGLTITLLTDRAKTTATFLPYIYFIILMLLVCMEAQVGTWTGWSLGGLG